jgi:enoyl-CoA hydratase/carnithine racemase
MSNPAAPANPVVPAPPTFTEILVEIEERVLTITLNRPDKLNAFTGTMAQELMAAYDFADQCDEVRAVIVTGAGRGFCAGADLSGGAKTFDYGNTARTEAPDPEKVRDTGGLVTLRAYKCNKPLIAAINGPAVGVGITMTLPMDIRLASTDAKMGFVFARRGIVPEAASSWFLPRIVGISQAAEWCMTGRVFTAEEALAGRLVRSIHPPDELLPAARALALEIANNTSAVSVAMTRHMLWRMLGQEHPMAAHKVDSYAVLQLGKGPDALEGVQSFLEKRPAAFSGSATSDLPDIYPWWVEPTFS